jgi:glucuronoarabinoxylan endo-1,4-beta-xylanase
LTFTRILVTYAGSNGMCRDYSGSCYTNAAGAAVGHDDIANAQAVVALGGKVWGAAESAPIPMVDPTTGHYIDNATNNASWAGYQAGWVSLVESFGVPVYAISPMQEPDDNGCNQGYPNCLAGAYTTMTPANISDYIPYLYSALNSAFGSAKPLIMSPEVCCAANNSSGIGTTPGAWIDPIMTSSAGADVGLLAMHGYSGGCSPSPCGTDVFPTSAPNLHGLHYWMSEISDHLAEDSSMASGLLYAQSIHDYIANANASSYQYWLADCTSVSSGQTNNWCLTDGSGNITKRAYVIGNWSKFVRPGWVRIDTTTNPQSGVYVSAFKNPAGDSYAIVVVNTNSSATSQAFTLSEFPNITSVTPWVTSSTLSLDAQSSVAVDSNSFSFPLPAQSVTTFVGTTSGGSAGGPVAPPTGLTASVK